jgi:regulator of sigma E protease
VITTLLAFAFVLGVLVFVHELGHFLAAKRVGIRVLKFQLGFNPTILSFTRNGTEYGIGALPLGGYVKMAGDSPDENRRGEPDEFLSKTKWERFQVLIMGPVMNILLALVLTTVVLYRGGEVPAYQDEPPVVGAVAAGSAAEKAGIEPGDLIQSVAGHTVKTWDDVFIAIGTRPNRMIAIQLLHNGLETGKQITPTIPPNAGQFDIGDIGVLPNVHPHLTSTIPGDPADKGGLKAGDVILAINGSPMTMSAQLKDTIEKNAQRSITIRVRRDDVEREFAVTPELNGKVGRIGVGIADEMKSIKPGFVEAIGMSVTSNLRAAGVIFQIVWGLITRETSPRQLMGPVGIAQLSGESAQLGFIALLSLMATISLNLGLVNLLPIPVLDGGHIFIMAIEGLARRDFSIRVKEKMLLAGFVVLMMLMVTVIYNDLTRIGWIERLMPWR